MRALSQIATQSRTQAAKTLRDEARLLSMAGMMLLGIGFPLTLLLVSAAMAPNGLPPILPLAIGAPPISLGYIACHYASRRLVRAKEIERGR